MPQSKTVPVKLREATLPFIEHFTVNAQEEAGQIDIPQSLGFSKPAVTLTDQLLWRKVSGGHGLAIILLFPYFWFLPKD